MDMLCRAHLPEPAENWVPRVLSLNPSMAPGETALSFVMTSVAQCSGYGVLTSSEERTALLWDLAYKSFLVSYLHCPSGGPFPRFADEMRRPFLRTRSSTSTGTNTGAHRTRLSNYALILTFLRISAASFGSYMRSIWRHLENLRLETKAKPGFQCDLFPPTSAVTFQ